MSIDGLYESAFSHYLDPMEQEMDRMDEARIDQDDNLLNNALNEPQNTGMRVSSPHDPIPFWGKILNYAVPAAMVISGGLIFAGGVASANPLVMMAGVGLVVASPIAHLALMRVLFPPQNPQAITNQQPAAAPRPTASHSAHSHGSESASTIAPLHSVNDEEEVPEVAHDLDFDIGADINPPFELTEAERDMRYPRPHLSRLG